MLKRIGIVATAVLPLALSGTAVAGEDMNDRLTARTEKSGAPLVLKNSRSVALGATVANLAVIVSPLENGYYNVKNVVSVARGASTGQYCIRPSISLDVREGYIAPVVSADWGKSGGSVRSPLALVRVSNLGCPSGSINVVTKDAYNGSLSNRVAFVLFVP